MDSRTAARGQGARITLALTLALGGCGGGGGSTTIQPIPTPPAASAPTPAPTPTPTPPPTTSTPAPAPTPTPTAGGFQTAEFGRSTGLPVSNILPAYQAGATGSGITVGVVDSGIATANAEFAGRISAASIDLAGSRGIADEGGHGTAVSQVLLGAKNDSGTHGVAFNATLLVLRTDTPGSCSTQSDADPGSGCTHTDNSIARGVDLAVQQNARVVNISLGGSAANATLRAAISRATAAGMVIVISAGNDPNPDPDPLAQVALDPVARNQVIIAGSIGASGSISSFSARAGVAASTYLTALGERVRSIDETNTAFLFSGTSFSAPHIAGAVALLAQAFPFLCGSQIVDLLYRSADDLGAAGVDPIYGRGGLNIGRAFQPQGSTALAGSAVAISLGDNATVSGAMGDAGQGSMGAVILDGVDRAYAVDLAQSIRAARPAFTLAASLARPHRSLSFGAGETVVALSITPTPAGAAIDRLTLDPAQAERARTTAGFVSSRVGRDTRFAIGIAESAAGLSAYLSGRGDPAFLVAQDPVQSSGFQKRSETAVAIRHDIGRLGVTVAAESGDALVYERGLSAAQRGRYRPYGYSSASLGLDRRFGGLTLAGTLSRMAETDTVLGARFGPAFGAGSATSWFADMTAEWSLGAGWSLGGSMRQGWTQVGAGGAVTGASLLRSNAFAVDLAKAGLLDPSDLVALRISQPLRVASGGFALRLPTGYDYVTGVTAYSADRLNLTPAGREIDAELSYARALAGGRMGANLFWRRHPGNFASLPDDTGAAVRYSVAF